MHLSACTFGYCIWLDCVQFIFQLKLTLSVQFFVKTQISFRFKHRPTWVINQPQNLCQVICRCKIRCTVLYIDLDLSIIWSSWSRKLNVTPKKESRLDTNSKSDTHYYQTKLKLIQIRSKCKSRLKFWPRLKLGQPHNLSQIRCRLELDQPRIQPRVDANWEFHPE